MRAAQKRKAGKKLLNELSSKSKIREAGERKRLLEKTSPQKPV